MLSNKLPALARVVLRAVQVVQVQAPVVQALALQVLERGQQVLAQPPQVLQLQLV